MNYYRHIITNQDTNETFEVDNSNSVLSSEEIASLPFINHNNLIINDIDITQNVVNEQNEAKEKLQEEALAAAWSFITPYFDQPAFIQLTDWKTLFMGQHPIQDYIMAVESWKSAIMVEYLLIKKPSIFAGAPYDLDYSFVGSPPCRFTDLFLMANPASLMWVPEWQAPDITNYAPGTRTNPRPILF